MKTERKFNPGDRVRIIDENQNLTVPDGEEWENLGNHGIPMGTELVIPDDIDDNYDGYDNSWMFSDPRNGFEKWIHEGCLDYAIEPVTQDEEDEAIASILKGLT